MLPAPAQPTMQEESLWLIDKKPESQFDSLTLFLNMANQPENLHNHSKDTPSNIGGSWTSQTSCGDSHRQHQSNSIPNITSHPTFNAENTY